MRLQEIALLLNGTLIGNENVDIINVCSPEKGIIDNIAVANSNELLEQALHTKLSAIVVNKKPDAELAINIIIVENCKLALIKLLELFTPTMKRNYGIHPSATIGTNSQIHEKSTIGPNVVIGNNCVIAEDVILKANIVIGDNVSILNGSTIHPNTTIYDNTQIGDNVIIHSGCVIGSDGFGYHYHNDEHLKLNHIGNVKIDKNVEIGANTTIDRATMGSTHIGAGTKIDNLVQIAHNVTLGKNNILCAYVGIAGSVTAGDNVIFAADAGIADHVHINDNVTVGPRAGIASNKTLPSGTTWLGNPGRPFEKAIEQITSIQRIPGIKKQLKKLQDKVKHIESLAAK